LSLSIFPRIYHVPPSTHDETSSTLGLNESQDAWKWHLRLGHPGPQALEHLVKCSHGAKIRGPTTVECQSCGLTKAKRQIRREARDISEGPGIRLAVDFHDYEKSDKGFKSTMLVTDRWSGEIWDYYLTDRTAASIIAALEDLFGRLELQGFKPQVIECDNELYLRKHDVRRFLEQEKHMKIEPSAAHTQSQNGAAERSGGMVKDKSRAMREGAKLPAALWPEINRAAVYLLLFIYSTELPDTSTIGSHHMNVSIPIWLSGME